MNKINIHEAKTQLSAVLSRVEKKGSKYLICRNGKPVAELIPHHKKNRLKPDPFLSRVEVKCDLTEPLTEDEWENMG